MSELYDVGVIGLGVMGKSLARNFASRGLKVAGYDRDVSGAKAFAQAHPEAGILAAASASDFVKSLARPRRIIVLVNAGKPVDSVLTSLDPLLDADDVVVDAGNSLFKDTEQRLERYARRPWHFVGMGVSGGEEGALKGPSLMPGGEAKAYASLKPVLEPIAARSEHGACVTYCGKGAAGHFVKMVHNGIEYGVMQLIAESVQLLRRGLGLDAEQAADAFAHYAAGPLAGFLVEITADVLRVADPKEPGVPLVDHVLDAAGEKGTGRWTVIAALELGVPVPTISAAVEARALSGKKALRVQAEPLLGEGRRRIDGVNQDALGAAFYAAQLSSYLQGFQVLGAARDGYGYGTVLPEIARIWTGGCIIRAAMLDGLYAALSSEPEVDKLLLAAPFRDKLTAGIPALRSVVGAAAAAGLPVPGLAASLGWLETLSLARGSAYVIQAQRDYFGAHGYERTDAPGIHVHSDWKNLAPHR